MGAPSSSRASRKSRWSSRCATLTGRSCAGCFGDGTSRRYSRDARAAFTSSSCSGVRSLRSSSCSLRCGGQLSNDHSFAHWVCGYGQQRSPRRRSCAEEPPERVARCRSAAAGTPGRGGPDRRRATLPPARGPRGRRGPAGWSRRQHRWPSGLATVSRSCSGLREVRAGAGRGGEATHHRSSQRSQDRGPTGRSNFTAHSPRTAVDRRTEADAAGQARGAPNRRFRWSGAPLSTWWQVKDSNLRSFRDGFTVHSHWPLGQPAVVRMEG